jgi:hypothetical protein
MDITSLPSMNNTTFSIDFQEGLPPMNIGKIYVTDVSTPAGSGRLYEIKVEIVYPGSTDIPPINVTLITRRARI